MKSALAFTAAALLASPAAAEPGSIEFCSMVSEIAQNVMVARQDGLPMHLFANHLGSSLDGADLTFGLALMEAAYDEPLYSSDAYKVSAANEFANEMFRICRDR